MPLVPPDGQCVVARGYPEGTTRTRIWAVVAGLFLAIMPSYAGKLVLHTQNLALLALVTALVLLASCAAQLAVRHGVPAAEAQAAGLVLLALGLVALVLAGLSHSRIPLVAGTLPAGAGHGVAALAAQHDLTRIAPEERRGEVSAAFYVCIYLGVSLPAIGIGVLAAATTLFTAVTVFATATGVTALGVAAWHWRTRRSYAAS